MFASSFSATAASVTLQLRFFFYFARNVAYLFCGKLSIALSLSLCVFLLRNARHHLPGQDVPQYGRWWRRRPSSLPPLHVAISSSPFVLFCLLCCRHLRNWRSCWHAITFVLPSRRSSSRIREWLRILHMIILCRNCWRNRAPEVSAIKMQKQHQRNWKQAGKLREKCKKTIKIRLKIQCQPKRRKSIAHNRLHPIYYDIVHQLGGKIALIKWKCIKTMNRKFLHLFLALTLHAAVFAIRPAAVSQHFHCPRTSRVQEIKLLWQATLQMTK